MDTFEDSTPDAFPALSYDDTAYEEQLPTPSEQASLARRIGTTKVYLLAETTKVGGKRKHGDEDAMDEEDVEMDGDTTYRGNALLFHGSPIASLPTAGLFAYATHFDAHPLGLEWEPDEEGYITGKPIPVAIWPPEERINSSLGKGEGLKGTIRMRWGQRKHGWTAGKETYDDDAPPPREAKRRRRGSNGQDDLERAALDAELDAFIRADDDEPEPTWSWRCAPTIFRPMAGRCLNARLRGLRLHFLDVLEAPPRGTMYADVLEDTRTESKLEWGREERDLQWGRETRKNGRSNGGQRDNGRRNGRGGERRGRNERPTLTHEDLDAELDAFLEDKN
ncbi:hypothetical protein B0H14DRAFT_2986318 [Mycena olivaceomarginata]|nr:hypothetical protein B0H14DRAFT_2986318 [Mycena olivaceomarginata]